MKDNFEDILAKLNHKTETNIHLLEENVDGKCKNIAWNTYLAAFTANLLLFSEGTIWVWTSPVIPKLRSNNTDINPLGTPITISHISMIASMPFFCSIFSFFIMGKISDKIGRKKMITYISVFNVITLVSIAFATSIYVYYVCFAVIGFLYSGTLINIPIYNTEIAEDSNRGKIGCLAGLSVPAGMLYGYIFGPITSVKVFTLITAIPSLLNLLMSCFVIESPIYLASNHKSDEALKCLEILRNPRDQKGIKIEFMTIEENVKSKSTLANTKYFDLFKTKATRKAIYLSLIVCVCQQVSGISVILAFMEPILNNSGSNLPSEFITILIGSVKIVFYLIATYCSDKIGKRKLFLFSIAFCALSMTTLGWYFYLKSIHSPMLDNLRFLPVVCIITFVASYGLGLGPIPIAILGEFFTTNVRASGVGTVLISNSLITAVILGSFPLVQEHYGIHYCMFTYSLFMIIGFILIFISLPETKKKSLQEIQEILQK